MVTSDEYKARVERAIRNTEKKRLPRKAKKKSIRTPVSPKENWEHEKLVTHLRDKAVYFLHVPNEGKRSEWQGRYMFGALGALKGAADIYVFDRLPNFPDARGLAIELKRVKGSSPAWGSTHQHAHLNALALRGWKAYVCRGHEASLAVLALCGLVRQGPLDREHLIKEFTGANEDGEIIKKL
tara:strand:+ start:3313 stop:3861 length:549 start_codon:yes stop_codon:yes gene_type:complete